MSTTIKIPMNEETHVALEDCFIDTPNMDARKTCFDSIKMACQDAKRSERAGVTPVNRIQEDGTNKQEEFKLKGVNLDDYTLPMNEKWLPKNMDADDNKPIELKLGDNTMKYLKKFGQLIVIRHQEFNKAQDEYLEVQRTKMKNSGAPKESIENWEKSMETQRKARLEQVPSCLEEAIWTSIWPTINQKIDQTDGVMFDKEFAEMYPKEDDKKPEPLTK